MKHPPAFAQELRRGLMRRPKFLTDLSQIKELRSDSVVQLSGKEFYHLHKVLRLKNGALIELLDKAGKTKAIGEIIEIDRVTRAVKVKIIEQHLVSQTAPWIGAIIGFPKKNSYELIVEKLTELQCKYIIFFEATRSQLRLKAIGKTSVIERINKIIDSAIKQSGNLFRPEIFIVTSINEAIEISNPLKSFRKIIFVPPSTENHIYPIPIEELFSHQISRETGTPVSLKQLEGKDQDADATFIIGPEGGLTEKEITTALENCFSPALLGESVLRVETAAIVAFSKLQALLRLEALRF